MNTFSFRLSSRADYDGVLTKWWKEWGFPVPPVECLPRHGLIVSDAEGDLYAGFLYFTDSDMAWMEWVVCNRSACVSRRRGALLFMTGLFEQIARGGGAKHLFTSTVRGDFANSLCKCGFERGDTGVIHLVKNI